MPDTRPSTIPKTVLVLIRYLILLLGSLTCRLTPPVCVLHLHRVHIPWITLPTLASLWPRTNTLLLTPSKLSSRPISLSRWPEPCLTMRRPLSARMALLLDPTTPLSGVATSDSGACTLRVTPAKKPTPLLRNPPLSWVPMWDSNSWI